METNAYHILHWEFLAILPSAHKKSHLIVIFMIIPEIDIGENVISGDCATLGFYLLHYFGVLVFTLGLSNNKVFLVRPQIG